MLVPQPFVDAHGGVAVLLRDVEIVFEYPVYDPGVRAYLGSSGRLAPAIAGRYGVREHLANSVSAQAEQSEGITDAHAVYHAGSSNALLQFHAVHPSHLPSGRIRPNGTTSGL